MDFESPDVEKDFPGLYASESGKKSNESDFSDGGDHEKPSKKDLLGRRKDKKEKKDRGYAALEGESSPEEDTDTKSPSKSKKTKSFKFPTKSKEKREKSRDKEKVLEEVGKHKESTKKDKEKEKEKEKEKKEKEKKEKEKKEKLKEKDKEKEEKAKFKLESKEKLKEEKKEKVKEDKKEKVKDEKVKIKEKDKDKKDKKLTKVPSTVTSGVPFEEIFTLGVALPIFGVPLQQSVERSRCHDDARLPLVVRDSIDYLQAHGLKSTHIYRGEADKIKLQQLRKLYTDRGQTFPYHWDVPIACTMLKSFISELPESILTQELHCQFEQATAMSEPQRELAIVALLNKLPVCNYNMLAWLLRHFENVVANEQANHATVQTIATYMCPALNFSTNLLTYLITKAEKLFPNIVLSKYIPPLPSLPAECPDSAAELSAELRKQESLLSEIHAEMHAGFISAARDHQLWEAQRIVTQLKRKLRSVQKSVEPTSLPPQQSIEEKPLEEEPPKPTITSTETTPPTVKTPLPDKSLFPENTPLPEKSLFPDKTPLPEKSLFPENTPLPELNLFSDKTPLAETSLFTDKTPEVKTPISNTELQESPVIPATEPMFEAEFEDNFDFALTETTETKKQIDTTTKTPPPIKPKLTEKELKVLRLELENAEYLQLKSLLQAKINSEQFEIVKLRSHVALKSKIEGNKEKDSSKESTPEDPELKQRLLKENAMLEQKRLNIINQIFQERVACVQLKIELAMMEILSKS